MARRWNISGAVAVGVAVMIGASGFSIALTESADAAPAAGTLGALSIAGPSGTTGLDSQAFNVTTVSTGSTPGCPTAGTNVTGLITGPGAWSAGIIAWNNNSAAVSHTSEFMVPMSNSMLVIAQNNGLTITAGEYDITMTCQNPLGTTKYGTFNGAVYFTDATHWTATCSTTIPGVTSCPSATPTPTPSGTPTPTPSATATPTPTPTLSGTPTPTPSVTPTPTPTPSGTATPTPTPTPSGTPTPTPTPSTTGSATTTVLTVYKVAFDGTSLIVREGRSLRGVARVTPTAADGTFQIFDTMDGKTTALGQPRSVQDGRRRFVIPGLTQGTHMLTAVFTPASSSKYATSTSKAITVQVVAGRSCRHHDDDDHSLAWRVHGAD